MMSEPDNANVVGSSPGTAVHFSDPVTFGGQCGSTARVPDIKMYMFRISSVVPCRFADDVVAKVYCWHDMYLKHDYAQNSRWPP